MLPFLTDYAVPACIFILMVLSGTELSKADFLRLRQNKRAVLLGSAGQLLTLPLIALLIHMLLSPSPLVALGTLVLSLCPNGGISNYYCYVARCNVMLSATITAVGTVLSLLTIPLWFELLPTFPSIASQFSELPAGLVLSQLFALMVVPMSIGMFLRHVLSVHIERAAKPLRLISLGIVAIVLGSAVATVASSLFEYFIEIAAAASLFVIGAMMLGWGLGYGLNVRDRPVIVIESGVRNIGVALIIGRSILSSESFGMFASFLTGYFIVEVIIMMAYARYQSRRLGRLSQRLEA